MNVDSLWTANPIQKGQFLFFMKRKDEVSAVSPSLYWESVHNNFNVSRRRDAKCFCAIAAKQTKAFVDKFCNNSLAERRDNAGRLVVGSQASSCDGSVRKGNASNAATTSDDEISSYIPEANGGDLKDNCKAGSEEHLFESVYSLLYDSLYNASLHR